MRRITAYIAAIVTAILYTLCISCNDDVATAADPVLRAIPSNPGIIITTNDIVSLSEKIQEGGAAWTDLKVVNQFQTADALISDIHKLLSEEDKLRAGIRKKHFALSFYNNGHKINGLAVILTGKQVAQVAIDLIHRKTK